MTDSREPGHKPLQGGAPALSGLHGPGLGPVFVHAQHDQAVGQFGVDLGRRVVMSNETGPSTP